MSMISAGPLAALAPNTCRRVEHESLDILVARVGDDVYAIEDRCSHGEVPLSEGELDGCLIECWLHGSTFDLRTGEPTCPPAATPVRTFPVSINDQDGTPTVFVEIG